MNYFVYSAWRLMANLDADSRDMNAQAWSVVVMIPPMIVMVANNNAGIGMVHALRHARSVIANLPANTLGIGHMRKRKP
jgi:hypothetical protein